MRQRPLLRPGLGVLVCSLTLAGSAVAQQFEPQWKPTLDVPRIDARIVVDGELDDAGWRTAARARGFAEVDPGDQTEPPVHSEAWIAYDAEFLYVALIAHDDPETVRASLRDRDSIFRDDYFGVMLDTYGNYSWGYEIFVNPLGIQGDLRMLADGNEDISFDIVFESEGRVTDQGYQVELAIPFSSLRFPDREEQVWHANFWRDHQRDVRRRYAWAATDRDNSCFQCNWGTLTGIRGVEPSQSLDVIPSVVGFQTGALEDGGDPGSGIDDEPAEGEVSLNVRYGLTSSASAEATLNPDFSQIESDAVEIDVNSTFALFFPERRPFFQEGSDLYSTWIDAIYTRSIVNPDAASKLTGRFGNGSFLYMLARDDNAAFILPTEERSFRLAGDNAWVNIARARQAYGEGSHVGALVTDRRTGGATDGYDLTGSNSVFGLDGRHRFTRNFQVEYQVLRSYTEEPNTPELTLDRDDDGDIEFDLRDLAIGDDGHDLGFNGESFLGMANYVSLEYNGRVFSHDIDYWAYSPTFRTDAGFTTRNDYREVILSESFWLRPNGKLISSWGMWGNTGRVWNYTTDGFEDEWVRLGADANLPGQTGLSVSGLYSREAFADTVIPDIRTFEASINTTPAGWLELGAETTVGKLIYRDRDDPFLGDAFGVGTFVRLRPSSRLEMTVNWDYQEMGVPLDDRRRMEDDPTIEEGGKRFAGYVVNARLGYQFTRRFFLRLITRYDGFSDAVSVDPLFTYRVNPFTVFFAGATTRTDYFDDSEDDFGRPGMDDSGWELSERRFFAKFQYLFRL